MKKLALFIVPLAVVALGCGKSKCGEGSTCVGAPPDLTPVFVDAGCQPLMAGASAQGDCLLPYPSDYFRVPDSSMPSGFRVDHTAARPSASSGHNTNVNDLFAIDGYSKQPVIVASFPEAMARSGFVGVLDDPATSIVPSANVLIIEADTGALIPHYDDLDPRTTDLTKQAIAIHPIVGLKEKTRYVVAIHNVKNASGSPVSVPEGFKRLRDGEGSRDANLRPIASHFESDVFPVITRAGLARDELQLAWDFTTGSDARFQGDMLRLRELTLDWLAHNTPTVTITSVSPPTAQQASDIWYVVEGTVTGPLFLEGTDVGMPLHRDASGQVAQNGTVDVRFTAMVPVAVRDQFDPGLPMAYGHGFFGRRDEVTYSGTLGVANALPAVAFGIDWWGMDTDDVADVAGSLTKNPSKILTFGDRVHQAMANWMVMTAAIKGPLRSQSAFLRPQSGTGVSTVNGQSNAGLCVFGEGVVYLGISQGAILGTTMNAVNPDVSRVILHVGGAGFTHMMFRANPFNSFLYFMDIGFSDANGKPMALEEQKYVATLQPQFDRFDPATYAPHLLRDPLPGAPADRRVLMQNGLGDSEVPNAGTFLLARQVGLPLLTPTPMDVYGMDHVTAPVDGSAAALYDFGVDLHALYDVAKPATDNTRVHDGLRAFGPAQDQMRSFFATGQVVDPCDGGACVVP